MLALQNTQCKSCKLSLIWGQNEDCILEYSTSESSEKLLQKAKGEGGHICNFGEGEYIQSNTYFLAEAFC